MITKIMRAGMVAAILLGVMVFGVEAQVSFGTPEKINEGWLFQLGDVEDFRTVDRTRWRPIDLPHDWSVKGQLSPTLASCTGYLPGGIGWYHKTLHIPESKKGEKVYLYFEGVYNRSEVFLNGKRLGVRPNGYVSFMYDATPFVEFGKDNAIDVRVDHSRSADSRWYTGSGIYRDVWLVYANPVHISQWGVYAFPENNKLNIEVEIDNTSPQNSALTVVNELFAPDGKPAGKNTQRVTVDAGATGKITTAISVNKPVLWSFDNPTLYRLVTTVLKDGKEIDRTVTATGFRTFTFDPDKGFALNGKWMKMKGVCIHHDAGVLGAAVPREVWKQRILTLKSIGCNAIRTSHNPQATDLYALCDELGMLVLNEMYDEWEFPKRKWLEGWNVGTPGFQGSYDFFEAWGEKDLIDWVRRDRNHLSVFAWSIGNEVDYPNDPYSHPVLDGGANYGFTQPIFGGYKKDAPDAMRLGAIAKRLSAAVRKYDGSRQVTAGLAGVAMSNETEYPAALDIAGYNYTESMYDSDHQKYPKRVIYGSENRHDMNAWKAVRDKAFIFGQFLWTGIDYLGESGRWPARGSTAGLLNVGGFIKPRGYFRQSLWSESPMAYIGTYPTPGGQGAGNPTASQPQNAAGNTVERVPSMDAWPVWNYEKGQLIRVVCYTNGAKAQLMLNGKTVGETKAYDDNTGIIFWDIPYEDGRLEVIAFNRDNLETARYAIQSSKQPYALKIVSADKEINQKGLAMVVVQVVDENGIPVVLSDNEVTCRITGPAMLKGLEASNNTDMTDYSDAVQRVYRGRMLAYIQSTGEAGEIVVRFTSPWLQSTETRIWVEGSR